MARTIERANRVDDTNQKQKDADDWNDQADISHPAKKDKEAKNSS